MLQQPTARQNIFSNIITFHFLIKGRVSRTSHVKSLDISSSPRSGNSSLEASPAHRPNAATAGSTSSSPAHTGGSPAHVQGGGAGAEEVDGQGVGEEEDEKNNAK